MDVLLLAGHGFLLLAAVAAVAMAVSAVFWLLLAFLQWIFPSHRVAH